MQQKFRQLGLQNIIKTQQAKIHELKQQLKRSNQRQENRYDQFTRGQRYIIQEKDKMIEILKKQLKQSQSIRNQDHAINSSRILREKQNYQADIKKYKSRTLQLQTKINKIQKQYQSKLKQQTQMNRKLINDLNQANKSKNSLTLEIQNLGHFYKNAIVELPKRKQTLLWVNNLIQYMQKSEQVYQNTQKQLNSYVKNSLETLRNDLITSISKQQKNQQQIQSQLKNLTNLIKQFIENTKNVNKQIINDNQNFWQLIKKDKQNYNKQENIQLKTQIKQLQKKYNQQTLELKNIIRGMEVQKKTLLLGFQQLKNLNQNRQKTYKQQINLLKQTIQQLIKTAQFRQQQFENQIKLLGTQIQSISNRYYQNISSPKKKLNQNILYQMEQVKQQLLKIQDNIIFKSNLDIIQNSMVQFLEKSKNSSSIFKEIIQCVQQSKQMLKKNKEIVNNFDKKQKISDNQFQKIEEFNYQIKLLELRERENKFTYQLTLLKKHNTKLQQQYSILEKKFKSSGKHWQSPPKINSLENRMILLQCQNEALKQQKIRLQHYIEADKKKLETLFGIMNESLTKKIKNVNNCENSIYQTYQNNKKILQKIQNLENQLLQIHKSMNIINNLVIKPVQAFEGLVKQFLKIKQDYPQIQISTQRNKSLNQYHLKQITQYKNILTKRNQNIQSTNKHINDLIKTIRQNLPAHKKSINQIPTTDKQIDNKIKNKSNLSQKKIKQLQSQRIKDRQQIVTNIQKLQQILKSIDNRMSNKKNYSTIKNIQNNLDKKISNVIKQINNKQQIDISKITKQAMKDMQSKLKQILIENQGLIKQMTIIHRFQKIQKSYRQQ